MYAMAKSVAHGRWLVVAAGLMGCGTAKATPTTEASQFLADSKAATAQMMAAMERKPLGKVDADFVAMMVPYHQGAIDLAQAELRYGRNEQLRRLAQEIIVTQQQEIVVMGLAIARPVSQQEP
jgi:uncharacterized protein (DUF305 family)